MERKPDPSVAPLISRSSLILSRAQVREVDRRAIADFGMTGLVLMENAGRNAACLLEGLGVDGRVVICCGKGNNAGDGFVIARHLDNSGFEVRVLLASPSCSFAGDAAENFAIIRRSGIPIEEPSADLRKLWDQELSSAVWIVDALLGTGTQGTLREPFLTAIGAINSSGKNVLAVDLPSGLDCDTGEVLGACVRAQHTATFVARKPGFDLRDAENWTGQVHVLDIGVPRLLLAELIESSMEPTVPSE